MAHNGEELFALPFSEYPELAQTEKDIKLFDQLFSLCGSRRPTSVPSLQHDSWPSDEVVGSFILIFEAIRTASRDCPESRPNALKITKETTHDLVLWTRRASTTSRRRATASC